MAIYIGVGDKAKKVVGGYAGLNGKAEIIYGGGSNLPSGYLPYTYLYKTSSSYDITFDILKVNNDWPYHFNTYTQVICDFQIKKPYRSRYANANIYQDLFAFNDSYSAYIYYPKNTTSGSDNIYRDCYLHIRKGNQFWTSSESLQENITYNINMTKNDSGDCYFQNQKIFSTIESIGNSNSIEILGTGLSYGNDNDYGSIYLKGLRIYDLLEKKDRANLVPANQTSGSVTSGLFDTISNNRFFSHSSTYICTNNLS